MPTYIIYRRCKNTRRIEYGKKYKQVEWTFSKEEDELYILNTDQDETIILNSTAALIYELSVNMSVTDIAKI